jgi:hypothetical protein
MKRFFFPFAKKYDNLSEHIWHRAAVVIYWILIAVSIVGIFFADQTPEVNSLNACIQIFVQTQPNISSKTLDTVCPGPNTGPNFLVAIIGTFLLSYIFQIIYYKIFLFVALGKDSMTDTSLRQQLINTIHNARPNRDIQ